MAKHYVGVADPKLVYVILEDRDEFDKIGLPATEVERTDREGHVLVKSIEADGVRVVFQHWIKGPKKQALDDFYKEQALRKGTFKVGDAVVWRKAKKRGSDPTPVGITCKIIRFSEKDGETVAILTQDLDASDIGIAGSDATNEWAARLEDIHRE
jgi:hypothetical protein